MPRRHEESNNHSLLAALARRVARILCCLAMGVALAFAPVNVAAAQDATLTLQLEYTAQGKTTPIGGATMTLYQVAQANEGINHFEPTEAFSSLNVVFDEGMTAAEMAKQAKLAADIATKAGLAGQQVTSDAQGAARVGVLSPGIYLVVQTAATGDAANYNASEPFLVSVPQVFENEIVWDVVAKPKLTPKDAVKPPTPKEKTNLSKTGDIYDPWLALTYLGVGVMLIAVGTHIRRRAAR